MTRRILALAGLIVIAATSAAPAMETSRRGLATSGPWSAYSGTGPDSQPLCGITTVGAEGRRIAIQQTAGETGLALYLEKDSWVIPKGAEVEVRVQFDQNPPIAVQATGAGPRLAVGMTFEQSVPFMRQFRAGRQIRIFFPSGNELPWSGGLNGSGRIIDAFNTCRVDLVQTVPTQPFKPGAPEDSAPTQPFGGTQDNPPGGTPATPSTRPSVGTPTPLAPPSAGRN
jgi:hypothetical protein